MYPLPQHAPLTTSFPQPFSLITSYRILPYLPIWDLSFAAFLPFRSPFLYLILKFYSSFTSNLPLLRAPPTCHCQDEQKAVEGINVFLGHGRQRPTEGTWFPGRHHVTSSSWLHLTPASTSSSRVENEVNSFGVGKRRYSGLERGAGMIKRMRD